MADNFNLDDFLAEIETDSNDAPKKSWSFDEIDALLGIEDEKVLEPEETEEVPKPEEEIEEEADEVIEVEEEEAPAPKLSSKEEKTVVFDSNTIKNATKKETKVADRVDDELDKIDYSTANDGIPAQEQTQVLMELADDEDIEETDVPNKEQEVVPETEDEIRERRALAQKTIGIYPIRNDNIDHQIMTDKVEKSPDDVRYRERFMNVPKQHLERTADYEAMHAGETPDPIEKAGRIIKKTQFKRTADLEPVPMIVSADAELSGIDKTIVAANGSAVVEIEEDNVDGQIKLTGFGEEEVLEQIDEENAEEDLKEKRNIKVKEFKLEADFDDPEEDVDDKDISSSSKKPSIKNTLISNFIDDEYENFGDEKRIMKELVDALRTTAACGIIQAFLTVVALIITGIISKSGGNLESIGGSATGCAFINIVILLIGAVLSIPTLISGIRAIMSKQLNVASGTVIVVLACLLEDLAIMLFSGDDYATIAIYTAAALCALALSSAARFIILLRVKNNFDFVTSGVGLYSTEKISGEDDAFEIGRGLLIGEPDICYNARMDRPSYFIENSFEDDPADTYIDKLILVALGAAALFAIIFGIIHKDFVFAIGTIAAVVSITIPGFALIASNITLFVQNLSFNKNGSAIVGHRAIEDSTDANAYVLDATDIFKKGSCSIVGIKTFHNMRIDEAILHAAALVIESKGPLADIFDNVILGKKDLLPPVETLAYEERLGLSAWIHGRRVLLGSRDLLINHNVADVPSKEFEAEYIHDNRHVVYLAVAGKISAMFVVTYEPDKAIGGHLRHLDRAGVSILVRSCDCNINEEMICNYFGLPQSAVKILSPVSGDIFNKYREEEIETAPAGLIHNGTLESSIAAFYEARELNDSIYVNRLIVTIYTGMALLLALILNIVGGAESMGITGGQIVLFQILWGALASAIPIIKRRLDK